MRRREVDSGEMIREQVMDRLGEVVDPCMEAAGLGLSLVDLGIVRNVDVTANSITVELGLTEPGCGFTHVLVTKVQDALAELDDARELHVTFDWSEPWTEAMMTQSGRNAFGKARARGVSVVNRLGGFQEPP